MAKNDINIELRKIIESIRKKDCAPVYILMGDEPYYIDLIVRNFEKYLIEEDDKDFNLNIFYGNDADIDYVIAAAQQFPVMAERKLIILKEAQSMQQAKTQLEKFASYMARPSMSTVFVLAFKGESLNASSKLIKGVKEGGGVIFKSIQPRDYELPDCIRNYCRERKVKIDDKAIELLAQYIGNPLSKLFSEINKLIDIKGGNNVSITCEDIEKNIGISKDYNNFELTKAIGKKDYLKTIQIIKHFASSPRQNPTVVTTAVILNFFSNLVIAHYLPDKSDFSLRETFGFKSSFQLDEFKLAMKNFNAMQSVNAIHYLREFDAKSKGVDSLLNEYDLLAEFIFKIFT